METNGIRHFPDIGAALARLDAEDPPAHVRAQRLAALHVEMAQASHATIEEMEQNLRRLLQHGDALYAAGQTIEETVRAQGRRSVQELQRSVDARSLEVLQEFNALRQECRKLGKRATVGRSVGVVLTGALIGMLVCVAAFLILGQVMHVHVLPKPGQTQGNGQLRGQ